MINNFGAPANLCDLFSNAAIDPKKDKTLIVTVYLGVGVGLLAMFYVLIVKPYFLNMAWLVIKRIVRLIKFFL
jgi:hypothetical protein